MNFNPNIAVHNANPQVIIEIKFPDELLNLDKKLRRKLPGTIRRIALEAKSFWKSEAGRRLKSSRLEYQKSIEYQAVDDTSFYLTLTGFIPYSVEMGNDSFDMKPGFMAKAKPVGGKRRFPRDKAAHFAPKSIIQYYRIIPLNVNRYVNMQKPTVFRTVTDQSPASSWKHPGFTGVKLADAVIKELDTTIIPKHIAKLMEEK